MVYEKALKLAQNRKIKREIAWQTVTDKYYFPLGIVRIVKNFLKMLPKAASQGQNFEARGWLVYFSCGKLAYSGLFTSLCLWISLRALYKRFVKKSSQRLTHIQDTKVCVMVQTRFSLTKLKVNVSKNQTKSKISGKNAKTRSCSHSGYELSI